MKRNKRLFAALLAAVLMCTVLAGCTEPETPPAAPTGDAAYRVTVADALGTPYTTGVVVRFMQDGKQAAMQVVNDQGVAEKTLPRGNYTVELMFTNNAEDYYYNKEGLTLTASETELNVLLTKATGTESVSLFANSQEHNAYRVDTGSTYVKLTAGKRSYFLFTPSVSGTYEFSTTDANAVIGYYGAPHFVQSMNVAEVVDNKFTISVSASMIGVNGTGTTVIVIGIDSNGLENCILNVQRIGEPEHTISDEPWRIYQTTAKLAKYKLPAGAKINEFDLTAKTDDYKLVFNENDGFYHLDSENGPLVLVRLGEKSKYLDSFQKILETSGVTKYFFDENGTFQKKESYSECLTEYIANMDENSGVYPLTKDLMYIIQQRGEYSGWFDSGSSLYLFKDVNGNLIPDINAEISWLFMCCYISAG